MQKFDHIILSLMILGFGGLASCGQANDATETRSAVVEKDTVETSTKQEIAPVPMQADLAAEKAAIKREAMLNPDWVPVSNMPREWSGLYQKDCKIGGPEGSHFFEYKNHQTNTEYNFIHIVYPPSLNKKPKADVYPVSYKVWQNSKWPDHYLLFGFESFSQALLEEGWVRGIHQTLDGEAWDIGSHMQTKYRETDVVRWAADLKKRKDYGSRPPCDTKLAQPWTGQIFKTKSGQALSLQKVMIEP